MEIGNLLLDRADGGFQIPRGVGYEKELKRLFDAVSPDRDQSWRDYGPDFENGTFQIWPYSWCDCDCGFDFQDSEWSDKNHHADGCYQSVLKKAVKEWDTLHDYDRIDKASYCDIHEEKDLMVPFGDDCSIPIHSFSSRRSEKAEAAHKEWCKLHDARTNWETDKMRELCRSFGIKWNKGWGAACHCTCTHQKDYQIWRESHNHHPRCAIAFKSFLFKPDGFWIDWYKYPLRDAHSNRKVTTEQLREICSKCINSLSSDKGGPVLRLKTKDEVAQ